MALSLINHFYWQIPDCFVAFALADCFIIYGIHLLEKRAQAETDRRLAKVEKERAADHEIDKANAKATKKAERDAQKKEQSRIRPSKGHSAFGNTYNIQQPKKSF